jgi:hypothetical protein
MELLVSVTLLPRFLDVVTDHVIIAMLAHRTDKIAIAPKLTPLKLSFHCGQVSEDLSGSNALYNLDDFLGTVCRN